MSAEPQTIVKRDGSRAAFSPEKIRRAVSNAFLSVGRVPDAAVLDRIYGCLAF